MRWAWAANGAGVLSQLKSWAEEAEAATRFDPSFPDVLAERNLRSWETRLLPDAAMHLRPDDVFCTGHSDKFVFHRFTRLSKSGLVITTRGALREAGPICSLPSAFPPKVLDLLHSIHHWSFLPRRRTMECRNRPHEDRGKLRSRPCLRSSQQSDNIRCDQARSLPAQQASITRATESTGGAVYRWCLNRFSSSRPWQVPPQVPGCSSQVARLVGLQFRLCSGPRDPGSCANGAFLQ